MKKLTLIIIAFLVIVLTPSFSRAQATEQGNAVFDINYGFPNFYTSVLKSLYIDSGSDENVEIGGVGPLDIRGEYFVSDHIAIGLEFNYVSSKVSYEEQGTDGNGNPQTYSYDVKSNKYRIMPKFSFHYGHVDDFDFYSSVAAGYRRVIVTTNTNDPDYVFPDELQNLIPIAFRIASGGRYFFTDNIGLNLEIGIGGGALINGGLSIKL